MKRILIAIALMLSVVFAASACSLSDDQATDPSYQTLRYEGGDTGGSKFKECLDPGQKIATNDKLYPYPTTQRQDTWDSDFYVDNDGDGVSEGTADHKDLQLTAKGGVTVDAKVKVDFALNTSCSKVTDETGKVWPGGVVQAFHELVGKTRGAYFNVGDSGNKAYSDGWIWAMDNYITIPVVNDLTSQAKSYTPDDLWQDASAADAMEEQLKENIEAEINAGMETDLQFYHIAGIQIYKLTPSSDYLDLFKQRQAAKVSADTAQANKHARIVEAKANTAVAHQEALQKKAEVSGYGSVRAYLMHEAIEAGMNPFQIQSNGVIAGQ